MFWMKFLSLTVLIGGLLLSACGSSRVKGPVNVDVTLKEFSVESSVTNFGAGIPYHFIIKNEGQIAHEFMIMPASDEHESMPGMTMDEHHEIALLTISEEQLPPGAIVEVDFTFEGVPEEKMEIVCRTPGHFEAGMHIPVSIE